MSPITDLNRKFPHAFLATFLLLAGAASAQQPIQEPQTPQPPQQQQSQKQVQIPSEETPSEGVPAGRYVVTQSIEFGGHIADFTGSRSMWSTYVNIDSGPRLLDQALEMRAPNHDGILFDDFSFSNFGYGGDPNNVTRLRMMKGRWYNFQANFRRDKAFFDYNLLANPLNPTTGSNPVFLIPTSPHLSELVRRMQDYRLDILPLAKIRLRIAYIHNVNEGPAFSSIHEGTDTQLAQTTRRNTNTWQGGVSFRILPRTNLNYDQFYTYYKDDTSWNPSAFFPVVTTNGAPVDPGLIFNTSAGQPCNPFFTTPNVLNPTCNAFLGFTRTNPVRNSYPTEQFSFQSSYFKRADMSGRFSYTGSDSDRKNLLEQFNGFSSKSRLGAETLSGPSFAQRVSVDLDYGITFAVTDRFRLIDTFRWADFRIPGIWNATSINLFTLNLATPPNMFTPATCPPPFIAATCPQHNTSSGPDVENDSFINYLGQDNKINTFEGEYDFSRAVRARLGFRYEHREITLRQFESAAQTFFPGPTAALATRGNCATGTVVAGICSVTNVTSDDEFTPINAYSGLFGISFHPSDKFRANFDTELMSADNTFTRISPRNLQIYKVRTSYRPVEWADLGMSISIEEKRNPQADVQNHQHDRYYSFQAGIHKSERAAVILDYSYQDVFSATNICYVSTPAPIVNIKCGTTTFLQGISIYSDAVHSGGLTALFQPVKRVSFGLGYHITSSVGNSLILNPNQPVGPLSYNYHLPSAMLGIDINKSFTFKSAWDYYDYNEKSDPGSTLPRDFRGSVFTISLRYSQLTR